MRKEDCCIKAGITTTMAELRRNENVYMVVILKKCNVLNCSLNDILE